jgi:hypothetical protein
MVYLAMLPLMTKRLAKQQIRYAHMPGILQSINTRSGCTQVTSSAPESAHPTISI